MQAKGESRDGAGDGVKHDLLSDVKSAVDSLREQLDGQSRKLERAYEFLRTAASLAGEWMEPSALESVKAVVRSGEASLNEDLERVRNRLADRVRDVYDLVNRGQSGRGCVLHPIAPTPARRSRRNSEPAADVVFVHGLDGNAFDTWQFDPRWPLDSWPFWMASELPHVGVWALSYPAASRERRRRQGLSLGAVAKGALEALAEKGVGKRPLALVAHSLGGLVVKKMAHLSDSIVHARGELGYLRESLKGVVFLATPHGGSYLGTLADALGLLYGRTITVESLRKNDPAIDEVGVWFRAFAHERHLHVHVHRETLKLGAPFFRFFVVEPTSADPGIHQAKLYDSAGKDHRTICKCGSKDDPVYERTRELVLAIAPAP